MSRPEPAAPLARRVLNDRIDLRHLRYALLSAELRSFAKAAARLGIKQATLSRHIAYLEWSLGASLFDRSPRGVTLTEAGVAFMSSARRVLGEMHGLHERTRAAAGGLAGQLSIGFVTSITAGNLRSSLFAFQEEYPDIEVRSVEKERCRLLARLETGSLDVLVISGSNMHPETCCLNLWSERLLVALPHDHPLVSRERVYWPDLHGETFLAPATTADDIRAFVQMRLGKPGSDPRVIVMEVSRETVLGAVSGGRAVTLVSAASSGMRIDNVVLRPLFDEGGPALLGFSAYWRLDNRNPALITFLDFVRRRYSLALPED